MQTSPKKAETDGARVTDEAGDNGTGKRARRKTGRPQLAPDERRDDRLSGLRVTAAERAMIEANAARAGLLVMDYIRQAATGAKIVERASGRSLIPPGLLADLARVGNNLNQIAHAAHLGRDLRHNAEATLADLRALLDAIAARLSGDGA